jgi:hypothetical protein
VDGVGGADAMPACADEVGAHPAVIAEGGMGVPVPGDGLVAFRAFDGLLRRVTSSRGRRSWS